MNIFKNFPAGTISEIIPGVYLTDKYGAANKNQLDLLNIKKIISLGNDYEIKKLYKFFPDRQYFLIKLDDNLSAYIAKFFSQCNNIISEALNNGENILVHCNAGVSRSSTIVISYLMDSDQNYYDAYNYVKNKREIINPNISFVQQLIAYYPCK